MDSSLANGAGMGAKPRVLLQELEKTTKDTRQFAMNDSVPSRGALAASLLPYSARSNSCSFFCPLVVPRALRPTRRPCGLGLRPDGPSLPSADSRRTLKMDRSILTHGAVKGCAGLRSKFDRSPRPTANLRPALLVELASLSHASSPRTVGLLSGCCLSARALDPRFLQNPVHCGV